MSVSLAPAWPETIRYEKGIDMIKVLDVKDVLRQLGIPEERWEASLRSKKEAGQERQASDAGDASKAANVRREQMQ